MKLKQLIFFLLFVGGILGLCYLINENSHVFRNLSFPRVNISMPRW